MRHGVLLVQEFEHLKSRAKLAPEVQKVSRLTSDQVRPLIEISQAIVFPGFTPQPAPICGAHEVSDSNLEKSVTGPNGPENTYGRRGRRAEIETRHSENWPTWRVQNASRNQIEIQRRVAAGEVNETKTEASLATLPLDPDLAELLMAHKSRFIYPRESDFVFAGPYGKPSWPDSILADHLQPAAKAASIGKIGWHTFRHTYSPFCMRWGRRRRGNCGQNQ